MREMKDSGIEWVGHIPSEWDVMPNKHIMKKQKDICPVYGGEDILSLTMNGVIIRDLENPSGKMPATFDGYQRVHKGNLLMCLFDIDVTPRCIGLIENDGLVSPAYSQFVLKDNADVRYYYYYYLMMDNSKELLHLAKNLRHSFTEDQLGAIFTPVPPMEQQIKIAKTLDEKLLDVGRLTANVQTQIEKLKSYKQSLITEVVTKGLDHTVPMKDSGVEWIGKIPAHWDVVRIKQLGTARNGLTYSPADVCGKDEGTLVLRSSNIQDGHLCFNDNVYVTTEIKDELMVRPGDILICSRNGSRKLIGKNAIIDSTVASFGAFMMIFRTKYSSTYIKYILDSSIFAYYLGTFLTATINQLTGTNFGSMAIPFAWDKEEQEKIVSFLQPKCTQIDRLITIKQQKIEKLNQYKKSLIYEYVTGKKEVG